MNDLPQIFKAKDFKNESISGQGWQVSTEDF